MTQVFQPPVPAIRNLHKEKTQEEPQSHSNQNKATPQKVNQHEKAESYISDEGIL